MKELLFISLIISLTVAACGSGGGKANDIGDALICADTNALLREVETMYVGDERPDSTILVMFMRSPEFQERGVPDHLSLIGPNSTLSEDRVSLCNFITTEEIFGGKRRILEAEWVVGSCEFFVDAEPSLPPSNGFLRVSYEIRPDTLILIDSFYYDEGFEF